MTTEQTTLYEKYRQALRTGYHWCLACQHITNLRNPGEPHQCCALCNSRKVTWHPPLIQEHTRP